MNDVAWLMYGKPGFTRRKIVFWLEIAGTSAQYGGYFESADGMHRWRDDTQSAVDSCVENLKDEDLSTQFRLWVATHVETWG